MGAFFIVRCELVVSVKWINYMKWINYKIFTLRVGDKKVSPTKGRFL